MPRIIIIIHEEHENKILNTYRALANKRQQREVHGQPMEHTFVVPKPEAGETGPQFVKRAIMASIRADCRLVALNKDHRRYRDAVDAIQKPDQDIPDNIVE